MNISQMSARTMQGSAVGTRRNHNCNQKMQGNVPRAISATSNLLSTFPSVKCCNISGFSLQIFAEGGGDGAAASTSAVGDATASQAAPAQANISENKNPAGEGISRAEKRQARASGEKQTEKHPLSAVQYGKAEETVQAAAAQNTPKRGSQTANDASTNGEGEAIDKNAAFEKMIRGEYKEQFSARAQNIINQRFKQTKQLEAKSQTADALMQRLAQRYGVNASDTAAILRAAEADESYTEKEANTRGLSVDEMRRVKQLESENAQLRSSVQTRSARDAAQKQYQTWLSDGEKLKAVYPEFDFKNEVKNAEFAKLIKSGVPLRKAYETSHLDQILGGAMQYTADQVAKGMAARIADRSARPAENGTVPHAGAVVKPDVAGLSRADREEIERRVMRGEKILF